jgi:hypothetical protein
MQNKKLASVSMNSMIRLSIEPENIKEDVEERTL